MAVPTLGAVSALSVGLHSCALRGGRDLVCWGVATDGELGNGWTHAQPTPLRVPGIDDAVEIVASFSPGTSGTFACARKTDGSVACWGNIDPIHQPHERADARPRAIAGLSDIRRLVRGEIIMAIDNRGRLWNALGSPPATMKLPEVAEATSECALATDGRVLCWSGELRRTNDFSLGDGVLIPGIDDGVQLSIGRSQACVRRRTGKVTCFHEGNLPKSPWSITDAIDITAGMYATCVARVDRTVWCMGGGGRVLGPSTASSTPVGPTRIEGLTDVTMVSMGTDFACALRADGTVACWGDNSEGQLGDGTVVTRTTPRAVPGLTGVTQIAAGTTFACALLRDRSVRCWGETRSGAVGTYVTAGVKTPVSVAWP